MNLTQVVNELRDEQQNAVNHSKQLGIVITALETLTGGQPQRGSRMVDTAGPATPHKRTISAAGRKRIATAQKARWAKVKASKLEVVGRKKAA